MNRREFSKKLGMAGVILPTAWGEAGATKPPTGNETAAGPRELSAVKAAQFPAGRYTPYGYLDNPYHTWDLHPSGVVRSVPALGAGWYFPAGPGGYFYYKADCVYRSMLRLGFRIGDKVLFEPGDFREAGIELTASHHSKDLLTLDFADSGLSAALGFFLVGEDTLACRVSLRNSSDRAQTVRAFAVQHLDLGEALWWGRDGVSGAFDEQRQCFVLRSFAAGPVFVLASDQHPAAHCVSGVAEALQALMAGKGTDAGAATAYYPQGLASALCFEASIPAGAEWAAKIVLSRAPNQRFALEEASASLRHLDGAYNEKLAGDARFWAGAPRLEGDFPEHWKHAWVYDFETLRMMVRRPSGLYKHPWDGMQIQSPRNVLGETSIDMWTLAYADPEAAQAVLLGQFQDAVQPNVPCMREDGTMNMVAADGSECGTSIQWCYPFYCIESVFLRTGDKVWLNKLYPYLASFLEWTLQHRTDSEGWVVAKCSWESGMDASSRFLIKQPTGAELIDFIRVAEIQAATAHAARCMAAYAEILGHAGDVARWHAMANQYAQKTRQLFYEGWFYDVDSRTGKPIVIPGHREVTQVAPIMCGVSTDEQMRAMTPAMLEYSPRQEYWLEWASLVLPYAESMWQAGQRQALSGVLFELVDRAYRSMDRRELEPEKKLGWPGVSCEYWGQNGVAGGEGYGWGATLPAHIIRSLFGFRELAWNDGDQFLLAPNLPETLMGQGKTFELRNLHFRSRRFDLQYRCGAEGELQVILGIPQKPGIARIVDEAEREVAVQLTATGAEFRAKNHSVYRVRFAAWGT